MATGCEIVMGWADIGISPRRAFPVVLVASEPVFAARPAVDAESEAL